MTLHTWESREIEQLVNAEKGLVDRRIYSDPDIYQLELEHIFARAWNFMCHESQIAKPGDFFTNFIGEDRVIAVRDKEGGIQVLLNTCRHRGNAVCRVEDGHASSFMCTYHGWTYDLKGNLVGVPGYKEFYEESLKREDWGLIKAAKVDSYNGFVFATLDPEAPPLDEYLGDVGRMGLNVIAQRGEDMAVVDGVQKFVIGCNWKLAVDNVVDFYHPPLTHASAMMSAYYRRRATGPGAQGARSGSAMPSANMVVLGEYGHVIGGPMAPPGTPSMFEPAYEAYKERPDAKQALGPVGLKVNGHPHVFPNLWVSTAGGVSQVDLRLPRGPLSTEVWKFTLLDKNLPKETYAAQLFRNIHTHGPAGLFEQEDGENWGESTRGTLGLVSRRFPLNFAMNVGRGEIIEDELGPPRIESHVNEHAQLWIYRAWAEWMAARDWRDLKEHHSPAPSGFV